MNKMSNRFQRAKANMVSTFIYQLVVIISGILIPKIMIESYGSNAYGAVSSISQFLSYVTLLEGGIASVARAELYGPLAQKNVGQISKIFNAIVRYFRIIGLLFLAYTFVLACFYPQLADVSFFTADYTFWLVIVISLSTVSQYFFGIANLTLLNADQKRYISNVVMIITTAVNAVLVIVLVEFGYDILTVKLCSSGIFVLRRVFFAIYVKKHYRLDRQIKGDESVLKQKWTGIGQHLAYYLHTNTDIAVLTVLVDMKSVAVYSVYQMVVSSISNIVNALTGGMEAVFGEMIAKNEKENLFRIYRYYETIISFASLVLFGSAVVLIMPFVQIYTENFQDAQYLHPLFAMILLITEGINCFFLPCCALPIAANKFKETRMGAYGQALINVILSCMLVLWDPLLGVAIGTTVSVLFKNLYYFCYVSRNILKRSVNDAKNYLLYVLFLLSIAFVGNALMTSINVDTMLKWIACGFVTCVCVTATTFALFTLIHGRQFLEIVHSLFTKLSIFRKG